MEKIIIQTKLIKGMQNIINNKKETRQAYKTIYKNGNFLYATNGKMALKIPTPEISGDLENKTVYEIISIQKENRIFSSVILEKVDLQYPDIEKIFDSFTYKEEDQIKINIEDKLRISEAIITLWEKTKTAYNYLYLEKLQIIDYSWQAFNIGKDKFLYLKNSEKVEVLIMPFQIKNL